MAASFTSSNISVRGGACAQADSWAGQNPKLVIPAVRGEIQTRARTFRTGGGAVYVQLIKDASGDVHGLLKGGAGGRYGAGAVDCAGCCNLKGYISSCDPKTARRNAWHPVLSAGGRATAKNEK